MNAPQVISDVAAAAEGGVDPHAITTSVSLQEMRPRVLKRDDTFAVLDRNGDDFADLFEVRGERRERRGTQHRPEIGPDCVTLAYTGLDGKRRATRLRFDPAP